MGKKNRKQLKETFRNGRIPTEEDFADLVDSMVNTLDEGFDRTDLDGLQVSQLMGSGRLMSFYQDLAVDSPQWFLEMGEKQEGRSLLRLRSPRLDGDAEVLSMRASDALDRAGEVRSLVGVGVGTAMPRYELDVVGTVASHGRLGRTGELAVEADGEWHDITATLTGCNVFEVVAGIGAEDSVGKYGLLHAVAMNAFNSRNHVIDERHAWFGGRSSRIDLRWESVPDEGRFTYKLQMRADAGYESQGEKRFVKYHITRLWEDVLMEESTWEPRA